ncbi:MAG: hypothetical protein ACI4BD_06700 [Paludibacteraceae bacterium]
MNALLKNLGVIILLVGVAFLVVYNFAMQTNWLLVAGLATELAGILTYIVVNKFVE